jgi:hypothetical protein
MQLFNNRNSNRPLEAGMGCANSSNKLGQAKYPLKYVTEHLHKKTKSKIQEKSKSIKERF